LVALGALHRARVRGERRVWLAVAVSALVFASEIAYPLHLTLTDQLRTLVRTVGGPEAIAGRRPLQVAVIVCLLPVGAYGLVRALRNEHRSRSAKLALAGTVIGWTGLTLEVISLHHLDQARFVYPAFRYSALALTALGVARGLMRAGPPPPS
jgi:hypothetical protein